MCTKEDMQRGRMTKGILCMPFLLSMSVLSKDVDWITNWF